MKQERKKLYVYACINYTVGIILGIILFYGQMKNNPEVFSAGYVYGGSVGLPDVIRAWWLNIMWLMATFIVHSILPASPFHIMLAIRGMAGAFSVMYILKCVGFWEAVISVIPQCFSILPVLIMFSVSLAEKRYNDKKTECGGFILRRRESINIFVWALIAAVTEVGLFNVFFKNLF